MSTRFVRQSSYRHVYGQPTKRENCYDNIKVSASAWDTNLAAVNPKYIAVNYQASGGGAFLVCPLTHSGKLPDVYPLCRAHTAPVLDTAWSPFDDDLIASGGEDCKLSLTRIDSHQLELALSPDHHESVADIEPIARLAGHGRKIGHIKWHPSANMVLASASLDIKIWDVEKGVAAIELPSQPDLVGSMSFNWTGTLLATTCKDKKLRIFDLRSGQVVQAVDSHTGVKVSRVEWMGQLDRICTTGFTKLSDRQVYLWDSTDLSKGPVHQVKVDSSSGSLMPFWSENDILFLAGKGDGNIRYFEYEADELHFLSEYRASEPQRGMCWIPRRGLNTSDCEIARAYKVTNSLVEPIPFIVPRKSDSFQSDIYPPAPSSRPALSASDFFSGKTSGPILIDLETQQATSTPSIQNHVSASVASIPASSSGLVSTVASQGLDQGSDRFPRSPAASVPSGLSSLAVAGNGSGGGGVVGPRPLPRSPGPTGSGAMLNVVSSSSPSTSTSFPNQHEDAQTTSTSQHATMLLELQKENAMLKEQVAEQDHKMKMLEIQLQRLKMNVGKIRELTNLAVE